jgi:GNAT superfamily N-acetyltransferase
VKKSEEIKLLPCEQSYWEFVRLLRLDQRVSEGFIETKQISPEDQVKYMLVRQQDYRVALIGEEPVGYVGVVDEDIRICTHPDAQGKGVGKFMLAEIQKIWPNAHAKIKHSNIASKQLFVSADFELYRSDEEFDYYKRKA